MVKQIVKIETAKNKSAVEEIFQGGVLGLNIVPKSGIVSTESCGHVECQKYGHCRDCRCERCVRDFGVDKDEKTCKFIRKARRTHGARYEYSKTEYTKSKYDVVIICLKHGEFVQNASHHLEGSGCSECAGVKRITKESLIESSIKRFGDKFDFKKTEFTNMGNKITITCSIHGDFETIGYSFLKSKNGCKKCSYEGLVGNKEESIKTFKLIHGDKYDYSQVEYIRDNIKVKIGCPIHGWFTIRPNCHKNGSGCKLCSINKRVKERSGTFKDFIIRSIKKFGNKFDYSNAEINFINYNTEILISCPIHGEFKQTPQQHMQSKNGCGWCGDGTKKSTTELFVTKSNKKHNNRYTYPKAVYIDDHTEVIINCPIHGDFKQTPNKHLHSKIGCRDCAGNRKLTTEIFIERSKIKHKYDNYDYSFVVYDGNKKKVKIKCPIHGFFTQSPINHLHAGQGCRKCSKIKQSRAEVIITYLFKRRKESFKEEHIFIDCKNPKTNRNLLFDFWIKKYNLCIEYDGEQHYKTWNGRDKEKYIDKLKKLQFRDDFKTKYCKKHRINLLRIPYWDFNKIEELVIAAIEKIKVSKTGYVSKLY